MKFFKNKIIALLICGLFCLESVHPGAIGNADCNLSALRPAATAVFEEKEPQLVGLEEWLIKMGNELAGKGYFIEESVFGWNIIKGGKCLRCIRARLRNDTVILDEVKLNLEPKYSIAFLLLFLSKWQNRNFLLRSPSQRFKELLSADKLNEIGLSASAFEIISSEESIEGAIPEIDHNKILELMDKRLFAGDPGILESDETSPFWPAHSYKAPLLAERLEERLTLKFHRLYSRALLVLKNILLWLFKPSKIASPIIDGILTQFMMSTVSDIKNAQNSVNKNIAAGTAENPAPTKSSSAGDSVDQAFEELVHISYGFQSYLYTLSAQDSLGKEVIVEAFSGPCRSDKIEFCNILAALQGQEPAFHEFLQDKAVLDTCRLVFSKAPANLPVLYRILKNRYGSFRENVIRTENIFYSIEGVDLLSPASQQLLREMIFYEISAFLNYDEQKLKNATKNLRYNLCNRIIPLLRVIEHLSDAQNTLSKSFRAENLNHKDRGILEDKLEYLSLIYNNQSIRSKFDIHKSIVINSHRGYNIILDMIMDYYEKLGLTSGLVLIAQHRRKVNQDLINSLVERVNQLIAENEASMNSVDSNLCDIIIDGKLVAAMNFLLESLFSVDRIVSERAFELLKIARGEIADKAVAAYKKHQDKGPAAQDRAGDFITGHWIENSISQSA